MNRLRYPLVVGGLAGGSIVLLTGRAEAHVKWFSNFDFRDQPRSFTEILDTPFLVILAVAAAVITALPATDRWLRAQPIYQQINEWLAERRHHSIDVVRYAMAAVLIVTWSSRALLTPELAEPVGWIGWVEFAMAIALLVGRGLPAVGIGFAFLWLVGVWEYGAFHMLDYLHILGIAAFFGLRGDDRDDVRGLALPILYGTVGLSLMWLGFEKLVYPDWSLAILDTRPILRLGLPPEFFLDMAAFVEIGLGFLLIIGLLGRPLALTITVVFVMSTMVFGRIEVIGHTPVHAALVVFLLHGSGSVYPAPIKVHKDLRLRSAFAGVNFVLVTLVVGWLYTGAASAQFNDAIAEQGERPDAVQAATPTPSVFSVTELDSPTGSDLVIEVANWKFIPPGIPDAADDPAATISTREGYGILTSDQTVVARFDQNRAPLWTELEGDLVLFLFTADGSPIHVDGEPLGLEIKR